MQTLLLVVKDDFLSKGIALGLLDTFRSIHTTKNPYEAIEISKQKDLDVIITNIGFDTLDSDKFLSELSFHSKSCKAIIILKDAPFTIKQLDTNCEIIIKDETVSVNGIIESIGKIKTATQS